MPTRCARRCFASSTITARRWSPGRASNCSMYEGNGGRPLDVDALIAGYQATLPFGLDDFQRDAIVKLEQSRGVLVSAPTSSGKTVVAEYVIWKRLSGAGESVAAADVIYTTPLKALSNQKYRDLCDRYGSADIGLVTGEHTVNDSAPVLVMTTEILRNVLYDESARVDRGGADVPGEVTYRGAHA